MSDDLKFELDANLEDDSDQLADWELCQVRLVNDINFPWLMLVPKRPLVAEITDLSAEDWSLLTGEIMAASKLLQKLEEPHKLNIATLGNQVRQLHVHIIARFDDDDAWPKPIWSIPRGAKRVGEERDMIMTRYRQAFIQEAG